GVMRLSFTIHTPYAIVPSFNAHRPRRLRSFFQDTGVSGELFGNCLACGVSVDGVLTFGGVVRELPVCMVCTASCLILIGGGACIISVEWIGWG
ncbi:hypothetical protein B0H13DRAFT_2113528, partial [Mycena leptocephala]